MAGCKYEPKLAEALIHKNGSGKADNHLLAEVDSTVYGICAEGSNNTTLKLFVGEGDTLSIGVAGRDTAMLGGVNEGDELALMTEVDKNGKRVVKHCVNLTTLAGRWQTEGNDTADQMQIRMEEGGGIINTGSKNIKKMYAHWMIHNNKLVLSGRESSGNGHYDSFCDTFSITHLTADRMELKGRELRLRFQRPIRR
jgi:hypothetical protein